MNLFVKMNPAVSGFRDVVRRLSSVSCREAETGSAETGSAVFVVSNSCCCHFCRFDTFIFSPFVSDSKMLHDLDDR